ncbi:hypothetical protein, partial [Cellulomonas biazotea]
MSAHLLPPTVAPAATSRPGRAGASGVPGAGEAFARTFESVAGRPADDARPRTPDADRGPRSSRDDAGRPDATRASSGSRPA